MNEQVVPDRTVVPKISMASVGVAAFLSRLTLNTARRFAYPFAPVIARGLGVPVTAVTSIIALNQATGILGMFFGPLTDRLGYRVMMIAGLAMMVLGMFAAGLFPYYGVVLTALVLAGLGKNIFDPAIQSFVGEKVPLEKRGLVIGLLETSWAGSTLVGIPVIGLLIDSMGWRAPFFLMGGTGLLGLVLLMAAIPKNGKRRARSVRGTYAWGALFKNRAALGALGFCFFMSFASDNIFVVYGMWLEESFGLAVVALGMSTGVIGVAELFGEFFTAALADRVGLKRSVMWGMVLLSLSYLLLPLVSGSLALALGALFVNFLLFEFTFVTALTITTELIPGARATMLATYFAAGGLGRVCGAVTGGITWVNGRMALTAPFSSVIILLAFVSLYLGLKNWDKEHRPISPTQGEF